MTSASPEPSEPPQSDEQAMAEGYAPDSQLSEDLRPDENPLAGEPEQSKAPDDEDDEAPAEPTA